MTNNIPTGTRKGQAELAPQSFGAASHQDPIALIHLATCLFNSNFICAFSIPCTYFASHRMTHILLGHSNYDCSSVFADDKNQTVHAGGWGLAAL